ncbi:hypothetical protein [Bdellovibrio sp. HCB274]|uniref:hypothetical protein n=1 Tax=Bdellovibrio sp. HCB274 TaxID=3394361 RepID=UPI0039B5306D
MKSLVFLAVLFLAPLTWGRSTEFGNGGNAVICPGSPIMYDAYEAQARYGMTPVYPTVQSNPVCSNPNSACSSQTLMAKTIIRRLKSLDPELELILQRLVDGFWNEALLTQSELLSVNDTGIGFIERGCELKQLALQHEPLFEEDSRYFIAKRIWDNMFPKDQAALIIHEVLYNYALSVNPDTNSSEKIRYFNALLLSNRIQEISPQRYQRIKEKVFLRPMPLPN